AGFFAAFVVAMRISFREWCDDRDPPHTCPAGSRQGYAKWYGPCTAHAMKHAVSGSTGVLPSVPEQHIEVSHAARHHRRTGATGPSPAALPAHAPSRNRARDLFFVLARYRCGRPSSAVDD